MRAALLTVVAVLAAAAPAAAQDPVPTPTPSPSATPVPTIVPTPTPTPPPEPTIAPGVTAGGVDLSGMTIAQAEAALKPLGAAARAPITLGANGKRFVLRAKRVKLKYDANRTARRAYNAGVATPPAAGAQLDVPLAIEFIRTPIRKFVEKARRSVYTAPRDASVRITLTRIFRRKHKPGRALRDKAANAQIERALADPRLPRLIKPGRKAVEAAVKRRDLKKRYPAIITIDQSSFTLRLFRNLRFARSYGVAVGQSAYPTPNGLFSIQSKQVNPTWTAPNSPWAGELVGQSISGNDPSNPLKARWIGVNGAVGIHGTGQEYSIGSRASHGCIRMRVADVIDLYDRVAIGAPVLIQS